MSLQAAALGNGSSLWRSTGENSNGAQARVQFASLKAGLALDHLDFLVM